MIGLVPGSFFEGKLENYNCVLCHLGTEESVLHLFLDCPFAMSCWDILGLAHLIQGNLLNTISEFKFHIHHPLFMEIIVSLCLAIWSARNDLIFRNIQHSVASCKFIFRKELALVKLRAEDHYQPELDQWLSSLV